MRRQPGVGRALGMDSDMSTIDTARAHRRCARGRDSVRRNLQARQPLTFILDQHRPEATAPQRAASRVSDVVIADIPAAAVMNCTRDSMFVSRRPDASDSGSTSRRIRGLRIPETQTPSRAMRGTIRDRSHQQRRLPRLCPRWKTCTLTPGIVIRLGSRHLGLSAVRSSKIRSQVAGKNPHVSSIGLAFSASPPQAICRFLPRSPFGARHVPGTVPRRRSRSRRSGISKAGVM